MRKSAPLAALGAVFVLFAGIGSAQAQDSVPTVSRDTSNAAKTRADTLGGRDTTALGYRARLSGNCVQVEVDTAAARAASRDTTARDTTVRDTTAMAAVNDSAIAQATRDSLAAIRSAEAAGVYRAPTPPRAADSAAVACDTTGALVPADSTRPDSARVNETRDSTPVTPTPGTPTGQPRRGTTGSINSESTRDTSATTR